MGFQPASTLSIGKLRTCWPAFRSGSNCYRPWYLPYRTNEFIDVIFGARRAVGTLASQYWLRRPHGEPARCSRGAIMLGVVSGELRRRSGSLLPAVIVHALFNMPELLRP
jgi:hypothetical protein